MSAPPDDRPADQPTEAFADQLTEAFGKAADQITVVPREFVPSPHVDSQPRGTFRKPLLLVAVLILIAGALGALTVRAEQGKHDPNGLATETRAKGGFHLPSDLDDHLLDYIAPTNGDAWLMADFRFSLAVEETTVALFNECRRLNGLPEAAQPPRHVQDHGIRDFWLPALRTIAKYGVYRRPSDLPDPRYGPNGPDEMCVMGNGPDRAQILLALSSPVGGSAPDDFEASPAAAWLEDAKQLSDAYQSTDAWTDVLQDMHPSPEWSRAQSCMGDAGGPSNVGSPEPEAEVSSWAMLDWVSTEEARRAPPGTGLLSEQELTDMAHPEAEAFVRCTQPYYDVIESMLEEARADFVDEHEDELQDLRDRFKSLD